MNAWYAVLIVILILIILFLLLWWIFSEGQIVFYYRYPNTQHISDGVFGTDNVVFSSRLLEAFSDVNCTNQIGLLQTQIDYLTYPNNNQMYMNKLINANLGGSGLFLLSSTDNYTQSPPERPTAFNFTNSYVISSTNQFYIGKKFTIANVKDDIYQLTIN